MWECGLIDFEFEVGSLGMWVFGYRVGRLRAHQAHSTLHTHLDTLNQALHYIFDAPHSTLSAPLF